MNLDIPRGGVQRPERQLIESKLRQATSDLCSSLWRLADLRSAFSVTSLDIVFVTVKKRYVYGIVRNRA
jgi:hypothetical protein